MDPSESEKSKWMISKIEKIHESIIDVFESTASKYESGNDRYISKNKEWRAITISALVGALTIFLTLNSTYPLIVLVSLVIVIFLIFLVVLIFIIFTKYIGTLENLQDDIDSVIQIGIGEISFSYGNFLANTADIDEIDFGYVENYLYFLKLLGVATMVKSATEFRKLAQHYKKFSELKNALEAEATTYEQDIGLIQHLYEKFDPKQKIPKRSLEFMDIALKDQLIKK